MIAGRFAAIAITLYATHVLVDYWVQEAVVSARKILPGWRGRGWCAVHVGQHLLMSAAALWVLHVWDVVYIWPGPLPWAGLALIAVTHYAADRRAPLRRLAIATGHDPRWLDHGGGLAQLDQAWHVAWLVAASLLIAS